MENIKDIISKANKIIYNELKEKTLSVSACTELLHKPFDKDGMSKKCSERDKDNPEGKYYNMTPMQILEMWENNAAESRRYGSLVDSYAEVMLTNVESAESWKLDNSYDYDKRLNGLCEGFNQFYGNLCNKTDYQYVTREERMFIKSRKSGKFINGRFDCLFYSPSTHRYLLIDWKTNEEIKKDNKFEKMFGPMFDKEACDWNYYTVQVYMYKKALIETYNITDPNMIDVYICQFNQNVNGNGTHFTVHRPAFEYNSELLDDIIDFSYKKKQLNDDKNKGTN